MKVIKTAIDAEGVELTMIRLSPSGTISIVLISAPDSPDAIKFVRFTDTVKIRAVLI